MTIRQNKIYLVLIIILGAILRFFNLGTRPFDGDEGIIILISDNSWHELLTRTAFDVHPPLYHLLVKLSLYLGINTWTTRLISAISGIVLIYLVYIFTKKLLGRFSKQENSLIPLITSVLTAISPYLIYPSQEVRMYSLFATLALGSYYFFLFLIVEKSWSKWLGYILFSAALIYTQYLGFLVIFSQIIYLIFFEENELKKIWQWLLSWITILVLFIPQASTAYNQLFGRLTEQSQALNILTNIKSLSGALYRFGAGRIFLDLTPTHLKEMLVTQPVNFIVLLLTLIIPLILLICGWIIIYKKYRQAFWFLTTPIILAVSVCLFSSEIGSKASRYLIYLTPFYLIFLAAGFASFWQKSWKVILPIGIVIIFLASDGHHFFVESKAPGVNTIANYICQNHGNDDAVLIRGGFGGGEQWVFDYYYKNCVNKGIFDVIDLLGSYKLGNLAELKAINPVEKVKELLASYQTVWFYDLTYSNYDFSSLRSTANVNIINSGTDKEQKNLDLIKISEAVK